jgi:hypothetical protein
VTNKGLAGGHGAKATPLLEAPASNGWVGGMIWDTNAFQYTQNAKQRAPIGRFLPPMRPFTANPPPPSCPLLACYFPHDPQKKETLPQGKVSFNSTDVANTSLGYGRNAAR